MAKPKKNGRSSQKVRRELPAQQHDAEREIRRTQQHAHDPQHFPNDQNIDVEAAFKREKERRRDKDRPLTEVERDALAEPRPTSAWQQRQGKMQSSFGAWDARFLRGLTGRRRLSYHRLAARCGPDYLKPALRVCPMMLTEVKQPVPRALRDDAVRAKEAARDAVHLAGRIDYINERSFLGGEWIQPPTLPELLRNFAKESEMMADFISEPGYSATRHGDLLLTVLDALRATSSVTRRELADLLTVAAEAEGSARVFTAAQIRIRVKRFREDPDHAQKADKLARMIEARVTNHSPSRALRKG
jgi:hypothetical protein